MGEPFDKIVKEIRKSIKRTAEELQELKEVKSKCEQNEIEDAGEVMANLMFSYRHMANLMLSYRHLEDASMRLGKVLQAYDGGVSVYDKTDTVRI